MRNISGKSFGEI